MLGNSAPEATLATRDDPISRPADGDYVTVATRAGDLRRSDLILHPSDGTLHRICRAHLAGEHVVLHTRHEKTGADAVCRVHQHATIERVVAAGMSMLAAAGISTARLFDSVAEDTPARQAPVTISAVSRAPSRTRASQVVAAPTTVQGYCELFRTIEPDEWGGADVAITVPVSTVGGQPCTVWLFGDTLSTYRIVHSSAIVQTGGTLHVSNQGAQLLPDQDPTHIHWIVGGRSLGDGTIEVRARVIHLTGTGLWDFEDAGLTATARCVLDDAGNLTFRHWVSTVAEPAPDPGPMYNFGDGNPDHIGYARTVHPELLLADHTVLVTTCQNWTDGLEHHRNADGTIRVQDWQPVFAAAPYPISQ